MQVIDLKEGEKLPIFALIYGGSGTGKTHLCGTIGELGRTLIIDIDKGTQTLIHAKDLKHTDNITVVSFDKFKDLDNAAKLVSANNPKQWTMALGVQVDEPFDWVVWDTWSELQWFMLQELRKGDPEMMGMGLNFRKNILIQHWGMMTDLNKLAVQQLKSCNVNQVFTMQETIHKDDDTGQIYGGPAIHGKMVQEMPAYFSVVARTYTDVQGSYYATTRAKSRWPGKTRLGVGADFRNPTAKELFNL